MCTSERSEIVYREIAAIHLIFETSTVCIYILNLIVQLAKYTRLGTNNSFSFQLFKKENCIQCLMKYAVLIVSLSLDKCCNNEPHTIQIICSMIQQNSTDLTTIIDFMCTTKNIRNILGSGYRMKRRSQPLQQFGTKLVAFY